MFVMASLFVLVVFSECICYFKTIADLRPPINIGERHGKPSSKTRKLVGLFVEFADRNCQLPMQMSPRWVVEFDTCFLLKRMGVCVRGRLRLQSLGLSKADYL